MANRISTTTSTVQDAFTCMLFPFLLQLCRLWVTVAKILGIKCTQSDHIFRSRVLLCYKIYWFFDPAYWEKPMQQLVMNAVITCDVDVGLLNLIWMEFHTDTLFSGRNDKIFDLRTNLCLQLLTTTQVLVVDYWDVCYPVEVTICWLYWCIMTIVFLNTVKRDMANTSTLQERANHGKGVIVLRQSPPKMVVSSCFLPSCGMLTSVLPILTMLSKQLHVL